MASKAKSILKATYFNQLHLVSNRESKPAEETSEAAQKGQNLFHRPDSKTYPQQNQGQGHFKEADES